MPSRRLRHFRRQPHARGRGQLAEEAAAAWLERQGYRITGRNVHTAAGEIDLLAEDGDTLCFLEVKARAGATYGEAIAAVDARKQRRLARAAALYLARSPHSGPCRFDVLGIDRRQGEWQFTLVRDAFEVR
jgi:putative endonuclease